MATGQDKTTRTVTDRHDGSHCTYARGRARSHAPAGTHCAQWEPSQRCATVTHPDRAEMNYSTRTRSPNLNRPDAELETDFESVTPDECCGDFQPRYSE